MTIVNFAIPKTLERRVARVIKQKGFASKAEFFRFAAIHFVDVIDKPIASEGERFGYLTNSLCKEIIKRYKNKQDLKTNQQIYAAPAHHQKIYQRGSQRNRRTIRH